MTTTMNAQQEIVAHKAIAVLVDIAEDGQIDPGYRITAACAILDRLEEVPQETATSVTDDVRS